MRPFVVFKRGKPRFFWLEYALVTEAVDGAGELRTLRRLRRLMSGDAETRKVSVSLEPGDAVFVDNNRLLHGRDKLPAGSKRHLYRLWITTDGWRRAREHRLRRPSPLSALRAREPQFV